MPEGAAGARPRPRRASPRAWPEQAKLTAPRDAAAWFGCSVAISGSTALVGTSGENSAYVFARSGTAWSQQATLSLPGVAEDDVCSDSVAICGRTAVVGEWPTNHAYVFARSGTAWSQPATLTAPRAPYSGSFGSSVAISGTTAVVSEPDNPTDVGMAYVFAQSGDSAGRRVS